MTNRWVVHGLIQINTEFHEVDRDFLEKHGLDEDFQYYSEIIVEGKTDPVLKVPATQEFGWKRLTSIYSDDFKEVYLGTLKRTLLYYGAKVWINCPCVIYNKGSKTITLKADLFANNRKVPEGHGKFYFNTNRVSKENQDISNGSVKQTFKVPSQIKVTTDSLFSLEYYVNYDYELAPDKGTGKVIVKSVPKGKTGLNVDVMTIVANEGELTRLVARVYHTNYKKYVKKTDIPQGGQIMFAIDGKTVSYRNNTKFDINSAGYATVPVTLTQPYGIYTITVTYIPNTVELQTKYVKTIGCGTLYVGNDTNKPKMTTSSTLCTYKNNDNKELVFTSNKRLKGMLQLYIDDELVKLNGTTAPDYGVSVNNSTTATLSFDTTHNDTVSNYHWNWSGYHNIVLKYTTDDGGNCPMEYYYYKGDFYIQKPIRVEFDGEEENSYQTVDGTKTHVGDNLFYISNDTGLWSFHTPDKTKREISTTINHIAKVKVIDVDEPESPVNEGRIRLTFVSRNDNDNVEDNIENAQ